MKKDDMNKLNQKLGFDVSKMKEARRIKGIY